MIVLDLARVMDEEGVSLNDLAERVGITNVNLSRHRTNKVRAVRFSTLNGLCEALHVQPGDLLRYVPDDEAAATPDPAE